MIIKDYKKENVRSHKLQKMYKVKILSMLFILNYFQIIDFEKIIFSEKKFKNRRLK